MSETTMSAFARPITTRGLSISKMRPESGPEMHASERRTPSGRRSGRAVVRVFIGTGTRSVVGAPGACPGAGAAAGPGGTFSVRPVRAGLPGLARLGHRGLVEREFVGSDRPAARGRTRRGAGHRGVLDLEDVRALRA